MEDLIMKELCIVSYLTFGVLVVVPIVFILYVISQLGSMCFYLSGKSKHIVYYYEKGFIFLKK